MSRDTTYAVAEYQEELFQTLKGYTHENLEITQDVGGLIAILNEDSVPIAYVSDGKVEDGEVRQQDEALEDALKHLGQVVDALQDAGWSNSEIQTVERLMDDVRGQTEGGR